MRYKGRGPCPLIPVSSTGQALSTSKEISGHTWIIARSNGSTGSPRAGEHGEALFPLTLGIVEGYEREEPARGVPPYAWNAEGQPPLSTHRSHRGRRALHTCRPWVIR